MRCRKGGVQRRLHRQRDDRRAPDRRRGRRASCRAATTTARPAVSPSARASSRSWSASRSRAPGRASRDRDRRLVIMTAGATCGCSDSALRCVARGRPVAGRASLRDLYFGEALFYAVPGALLRRAGAARHRARPVSRPRRAAARLAALPHRRQPSSIVGDFELNYRMHHRAGRAITAVLEGNVDEQCATRPRFVSRASISRRISSRMRCRRSSASRARCRRRSRTTRVPARERLPGARPAAATRSRSRHACRRSESLKGFAAYNLGIALLQDGRRRMRSSSSTRAGQVEVERRRRPRDPRQVEPGARHDAVRGRRLRARRAVARPRAARRAVLEPGAAARGLGRGVRRATTSARSCRGTCWPARRDRRGRAGSDARRCRTPTASSNVHGRAALMYGQRARDVRQRDRARRRVDREHPRRASS